MERRSRSGGAVSEEEEDRDLNPTTQEFDENGDPLVEAVQEAILPAVRKFGWMAVIDSLYVEPLWGMRNDGPTREEGR